eukprot:GHVS01011772.1.p1 GENE.GHVS01011772.1~~GHVS01011772.1.p1  ORF type:complete len:172 (+),score=45.10 GHVS01011772.1:140-655(+)
MCGHNNNTYRKTEDVECLCSHVQQTHQRQTDMTCDVFPRTKNMTKKNQLQQQQDKQQQGQQQQQQQDKQQQQQKQQQGKTSKANNSKTNNTRTTFLVCCSSFVSLPPPKPQKKSSAKSCGRGHTPCEGMKEFLLHHIKVMLIYFTVSVYVQHILNICLYTLPVYMYITVVG